MSIKETLKPYLRPVQKAMILSLRKMSKYTEMVRYTPLRVRNSSLGANHIGSILSDGAPAAIGKMGNIELSSLVMQGKESIPRETWNWCLYYLHTNAGVHPATDENFKIFYKEYTEALQQLDLLGVWYNPGEASIAKQFCRKAFLSHYWCLEPYYHKAPWTAHLEGKTVLVMHPFVDTITKQYAKRELVWSQFPQVLPEFNLQTIRVPLSDALVKSPFECWKDCLDDLKDQMAAVDFDVALIGAGAYSLPLCAHAKSLGKVGIHLGGSTQILFGVIGDRWTKHSIISRFFNEHWCHPSADESPSSSGLVEGGCYW